MARPTPSSRKPMALGPGKQPKHFLGQKDALKLAGSIVDAQEGKTFSRAEKYHRQQPPDHKSRAPTSKDRIKETKAVLVARRARTKKDKARKRKEAGVSGNHSTGSSMETPGTATRKKVSFA